MRSLICLIPLVLLAAACTDSPQDPPSADGGTTNVDAQSQGEAIVNGKPASEFYGQFVWETSNGKMGGAASFPQSGTFDATKWDFFLRTDGSYAFFYAEGSGTVSPTGASLNLDTSTFKKLEGDWSIEGADLLLSPYLRCSGLVFNDAEVLSCELLQVVNTSAAVGSEGIARLSAPSSPFDSEWSEYP